MDKEQLKQLEEFKKRIETLGESYRLKEKNRRHERGEGIYDLHNFVLRVLLKYEHSTQKR
jgi:hypothetical protein